ncbi:MAG: low temperature requirement protein A, partial [Ottowia sp.]|nr:low temperature requirement protein A [Ottowia sp.]
VPMVFHWLRAAKGHPDRRKACTTYAVTIVVAQVLWCLLVVVDLSVAAFYTLAIVPFLVELAGPIVAEFHHGGTPWHAHHIAERYGLLAIITLGEGIIGTVAAMSAFVNPPGPGWTSDAITLLASGVVLTFGMWWVYFAMPWADLLTYHRERSFFWGYGHMVVFGSIAAVGAGLHAVQ